VRWPSRVEARREADVLRVAEAEAERRAHEPKRPDRASLDELAELRRLGVVAVHEGLHQDPPGPVGGFEGALDLLRAAVERLLAEDVLAGLERPDRPLDVQRVRQRDVDGLDVVVGEERLVAPVCALDPLLARIGLRARLVAARHGDDLDPVGLARAREDEPVDVRRRDDAPPGHSASSGLSAG
jgi:hypothetical protein